MCVLSIDHRIFRTFPRFYITYHIYKVYKGAKSIYRMLAFCNLEKIACYKFQGLSIVRINVKGNK